VDNLILLLLEIYYALSSSERTLQIHQEVTKWHPFLTHGVEQVIDTLSLDWWLV